MLTEKMLSKLLIPTLICNLIVITAIKANDQPQWGQKYSRNMVSDETHLPESFDPDTGKNVKWIANLGTETYSTPVVGGGRVLIGTNNNIPRDSRHKGDRGVLLCLDEKDGSLYWQLVVPKLIPDLYRDWPRSGICSPATVEGDKVYIVSNRGEVMCLDLKCLANGCMIYETSQVSISMMQLIVRFYYTANTYTSTPAMASMTNTNSFPHLRPRA